MRKAAQLMTETLPNILFFAFSGVRKVVKTFVPLRHVIGLYSGGVMVSFYQVYFVKPCKICRIDRCEQTFRLIFNNDKSMGLKFCSLFIFRAEICSHIYICVLY